MTARDALIEAFVEAGPREIEAAAAALDLVPLEAPARHIDRDAGRRFAAALLGIDVARVIALAHRDRLQWLKSWDSETWASEFKSRSGNFRIHHRTAAERVTGRRAGVVYVESEFEDRNYHPRVGAGGGDVLHRVYDLDAGWVVTFEYEKEFLCSVANAEQADWIRSVAEAHLGVITKHASVVLLDPVADDEVEAFRAWATAQLPASTPEPGEVLVERRCNPPAPDFLSLRATAPDAIAERICAELQDRFADRPRGSAWVAEAAEKARELTAMGGTQALQWARPILDQKPDHYEANLVVAIMMKRLTQLDRLDEAAQQSFEVRLARALITAQRSYTPEGLEPLQTLLEERPNDIDVLHALGSRHYHSAVRRDYGKKRLVVKAQEHVEPARRYLTACVERGERRPDPRLKLAWGAGDQWEAARRWLADLERACKP